MKRILSDTITLAIGLLLSAAVGNSHAADPASRSAAPPESTVHKEARLKWWREARFGMFIHWGPVSLKGTEISWSRANSNPECPNHGPIPVAVYDSLYRQFNPREFDADRWVAVAKDAGMKYVVLTAKHCDGFLLWHSGTSDYNMAATPFRRDIAPSWRPRPADRTSESAGISRRWTGAIRTSARSATRPLSAACKAS